MKHFFKSTISLINIILLPFALSAQLTDSIVGINYNPSYNIFAKMNIFSGSSTSGQLITQTYSSANSSCVNYLTDEYYFCDGNILITINAHTGNVIAGDTLVPASMLFRCLKYNTCDNMIYGLVSSGSISTLSKYDLVTRTITPMVVIPSPLPWGNTATLDPDSEIITIDLGTSVFGVDIRTGLIKYNSQIINLPGEYFGHIALKCNTHEIIGTSANGNVGVKYLSKIDPYTGIVTHISTTGWNVGVFKPAGGGSCINQNSGDYFYSGHPGSLVRVNTVTGNMISSNATLPDYLLSIDHFSTCKCHSSDINDIVNNPDIVYDQEKENFIIKTDYKKINLIIYDNSSRVVLKRDYSGTREISIDISSTGLYVYQMIIDNKSILTGKILIK